MQVDWYMFGYLVLIIIWSAVYKQGWDVEQKVCALKWGTRGFEEEEKDRPQFYGDPDDPLRRSEITGERELYYPDEKRWWLLALNAVFVFLFVALTAGIYGAIFYAENLVYTTYPDYRFPYFDWAVSFFIAITIEVLAYFYVDFSTALTDNENHKTQTDYEDALILKTLVFRLINHNAALMIIAFIKATDALDFIFGDCVAQGDSCVYDMKQLLWAIFIVRTSINLMEIFWATISFYLSMCSNYVYLLFFRKSSSGGGSAAENAQLTQEEGNVDYLQEVFREEYLSPFHDYAEAVIQFGYLNLYSVVLPYISLIALGETLIKMRMDAFKLCNLFRYVLQHARPGVRIRHSCFPSTLHLFPCLHTSVVSHTCPGGRTWASRKTWVAGPV